MTFITSQLRPKWHRFQVNFLKNVLTLIVRLSASCLGGLVLKRSQKEAVSRLLEGKDVLVVLPTVLARV